MIKCILLTYALGSIATNRPAHVPEQIHQLLIQKTQQQFKEQFDPSTLHFNSNNDGECELSGVYYYRGDSLVLEQQRKHKNYRIEIPIAHALDGKRIDFSSWLQDSAPEYAHSESTYLDHIKESEGRINKMEGSSENRRYWIIGGLTAAIAALSYYSLSQSKSTTQGADSKQGVKITVLKFSHKN